MFVHDANIDGADSNAQADFLHEDGVEKRAEREGRPRQDPVMSLVRWRLVRVANNECEAKK